MASKFHMDSYYAESLDPTDLSSNFLCPPFLWPFFPPFALSQDLPCLGETFDFETDWMGLAKPQEPTATPTEKPKEAVKKEAKEKPKRCLRKKTKPVGTLTPAQRRVKILRYLEKRTRRSFSRKVSYDCRKRAADGRLRIRGRFVATSQAAGSQESEYL